MIASWMRRLFRQSSRTTRRAARSTTRRGPRPFRPDVEGLEARDVPTTASLLGINTDFYILITFFLSGFLGGVAGTLVGSSVSIAGPYFGINFGLKGLAVIVLGGLGSIPGAVAGGVVIGLAEAFVPPQYSGYKDAVAFAILFIVLLVRPRGLLGRALIQKV